jgi:hypothetical protein
MLCRLRCLWRLRSLRPVGTRRTATAAATASGQPWFLGERWWSSIFLVEDIERRQTNVGEFLLTKKEFVLLRGR